MKTCLNLEGQIFHYLTVIDRNTENTKSKKSRWNCKCICGKECVVRGSNLKSGKTKSCGCLRLLKLEGSKIGHVTPLKIVGKSSSCDIWECLCDCGKIVNIRSYSLSQHLQTSCGCRMLGENNPNYKHGKSHTKEYKIQLVLNRKLRKKGSTVVPMDYDALEYKINLFNNKCAYCFEGNYESLDHIIPLRRGGTNTVKNLVPSCIKCNSSKREKLLFIEWQPKKIHTLLEETKTWLEKHNI